MVRVITIDSERSSVGRLGYTVDPQLGYGSEYENDIVIRWGNSTLPYHDESRRSPARDFRRVLNPSANIRANIKKHDALKVMKDYVKTPKLWCYNESVPAGVTVAYRPIKHSGGSDFRVITGPCRVERGFYATEWISTPTEYRVWFAGDRTMYAKRTVRRAVTEQYPCRSLWGYEFYDRIPIKLHRDTLKVASVLGLDFGAADILLHGREHVFLELNSAPTIDKQRIEDFFKESLDRHIKFKFPEA